MIMLHIFSLVLVPTKSRRKVIVNNTIKVHLKLYITSTQITNLASVCELKQNSSRLCGSSKTSENQQRLVAEETPRDKFLPVSLALPVMWLCKTNSVWYMTICLIEVFREIRNKSVNRRTMLILSLNS